MCEHNPNVGVCLEITENLPSNKVLQKWYGEPVRVRRARRCARRPTALEAASRWWGCTRLLVGALWCAWAAVDVWAPSVLVCVTVVVQACLLPTSIFLTNKSGYPVLSRAHQKVITTLYTVRV